MPPKEPALLIVLVETHRMRWLVGAIGFDQQVFPLIASQDDDLAGYRGLEFDEQASFLRHRFCGALQRGCDRLWGLTRKACQFVFVIDHPFSDAPPELTTRVAEHLAQWMTNPSLVFFSISGESFDARPVAITRLAGEMSSEFYGTLMSQLPLLFEAAHEQAKWEMVPLPPA